VLVYIFLQIVLLVSLALLSACSGPPHNETAEGEITVAGVFHNGFESVTLQPCEAEDLWWVAGEEAFFVRANEYAQKIAEEPIGRAGYRVFLRVRGVKSGAGAYGFLGNYPHELRVIEIEELRALEDQECL
jgi:hypothetical protein